MKKLMNVQEVEGEGLVTLLGQRVLLLCNNYFYTGLLTGVNADFVQLKDPEIVYETGPWGDRYYKDAQRLHCPVFYVQVSAIESYGVSKGDN